MSKYQMIKSYEYSPELHGYVVTFHSGNAAQTQFDKETNRLHGDFGKWALSRNSEYDIGTLSAAEVDEFEYFIRSNEDVLALTRDINSSITERMALMCETALVTLKERYSLKYYELQWEDPNTVKQAFDDIRHELMTLEYSACYMDFDEASSDYEDLGGIAHTYARAALDYIEEMRDLRRTEA